MKCRRCNKDKSLESFYSNSRNKSGYEHICKPCKSIEINSRRYGISEGFLEYLYTHECCMCCDEIFADAKQRHIHHTSNGVQGLVCVHCNHVLGQETEEDLQRIKLVLAYMQQPRENLLDRDNQQERLRIIGKVTNYVEESSETLRCESQLCSQCKRHVTKESFASCSRGTRKVCWDCQRSNVRLSHSKQAYSVRTLTDMCSCCDCELTGKKCVHHVLDTVKGVVCSRCNQLLGDESEERKTRLLVCKLWIESQWDYDKGRSAWRHAEVDRNDLPSDSMTLQQ